MTGRPEQIRQGSNNFGSLGRFHSPQTNQQADHLRCRNYESYTNGSRHERYNAVKATTVRFDFLEG